MNFAAALLAMQENRRVRRAIWNAQGLWIKLVSQNSAAASALAADLDVSPISLGVGFTLEPNDSIAISSFIAMFMPPRAARNAPEILIGWTPSSRDMLAEDWEIMEEFVDENEDEVDDGDGNGNENPDD